MPSGFNFYSAQTQAWVPLGLDFQLNQYWMLVVTFARLQAGTTLSQAQAELRAIYRASRPGRKARDFEPVVLDLHGEFTLLAGRTLRPTIMAVFAVVLLALLIACLNVSPTFCLPGWLIASANWRCALRMSS